MDDKCLIEKSDPQRFFHIWNELEKGTILGESTNMYPENIAKAYDVLCNYKTPENSTRIPRNRVDVSFHKHGYGNQASPPVDGIDDALHRDIMCYKFDRTGHNSGQCTLTDHSSTNTQYLQLGIISLIPPQFRNTCVTRHISINNIMLVSVCNHLDGGTNKYRIIIQTRD